MNLLTDDDKIRNWITANIGGTIQRFDRQSRWRGGWWADVEREGEVLKLYVREERKEEFPPWPLEHETGVLQILESHGVPVPHVYGICDDPHAIIMEAVPGSTNFDTEPDEPAKLAVIEDLAGAMARMHSIDPAELVSRGMKMPETPEEVSLGCFKLCEELYLRGKADPDPRIEFARGWIYRNIPRHRRKVSILAVDSAQFLHKDGKVTGLFDMEYACLGDPLIDLASVPGRCLGEGAPDVSPFFKRYRELTGDDIDPKVILFHRVWWGLCTPLIITSRLCDPPAYGTYFDYVTWYVSPVMGVLRAMAEFRGLELAVTPKFGPRKPSRWADLLNVMAARIPEVSADEPYSMTEDRNYLSFLKLADAQRDVEDEYIAGAGELLGVKLGDWRQADTELEKFVADAGPEHDEALIRLFHAWAVSQALGLLDGTSFANYVHRTLPRFADLVGEDQRT